MSHLAKINAFVAAYAAKDVSAIRDAMAGDIVRRLPGHHPRAGSCPAAEEEKGDC